MTTRVEDLGTAYLETVRNLLPDPLNPPVATVGWANATGQAALAPELLPARPPPLPPLGLVGPILAPITVGVIRPDPPDVVAGQFFLNFATAELFIYTGPVGGWKQIQFV